MEGMTKISIHLGNITEQKVDCIVNAANNELQRGGGVCGAIHEKAGDELMRECETLGECRTGEAKITKGYNLSAPWIIHTVGPIYGRERGKEELLLESCYVSTLDLAHQHGIKTIAFPAISTGSYGFPYALATQIAMRTVKDWIDQNPNTLEEVRFVLFGEELYNEYNSHITPTRAGDLVKKFL